MDRQEPEIQEAVDSDARLANRSTPVTCPRIRLHIQVPSSWLILLGLIRIVDTNDANLEGRVECQQTESKWNN
jgi:hypothetical protein